MINFPIDFVFPYVDNTKEQWRKTYIDYCNRTGNQDKLQRIDTERYDDLGLLKYIFRGIDKYMPWIRTIHMIVQDETQIPEWLDKNKIHIVLHKDIIPEQYLPTYNSTTIEMFLHNIEGLSEYFIYSNDDVYPTNYMTPENFFTEDGKPRILLSKRPIPLMANMFIQVCLKSYRDLTTKLNLNQDPFYYMTCEHNMHPFKLSHCRKCVFLMRDLINKSITTFRTNMNYNQYIYTNYAYLTKDYKPFNMQFTYSALRNDLQSILNIIEDRTNQQICLNDTGATNRELFHNNRDKLEESFCKIGLNEKSRYEV